MKQLIISLLLFIGASAAYAQQSTNDVVSKQGGGSVNSAYETNPLTNKLSVTMGSSAMTNHYLNIQEYTGSMFGITTEHGRFYSNSDRLSWKLSLSFLRNMHDNSDPEPIGDLMNAAESSYISYQGYNANYAVYYNWLLFDRLQVRAGGLFDIYGDMVQADDNAINNVVSINIQALLNAAVNLRYGWDFDEWGLDIYGNLTAPFIGLMASDHRFESAVETIIPSEFLLKEYKHIRFASMHNLQGINAELGVDFALKNLTISVAYDSRNRWWHAYGLQNYRKHSLVKLGVSMNLLTRQYKKSTDRHF